MQSTDRSIPALGEAFEGGFFAGLINVNSQRRALIRAPKEVGERADVTWNDTFDRVDGATSFCDGLANTDAMAAAASEIAQWARAQRIGGFDDWYIPSQDELEILYRNLKPTTDENSLWGRSGLNASALPPTYPYTASQPPQTPLPPFQAGGAEAFEPAWHWSSTQHAGNDVYAWCQDFGDGFQDRDPKVSEFRVVLVRSISL